MTKSAKTNYARINIPKILRQRREIAIIWSIVDVHEVRSDLTDDQAWQVLQACEQQLDATIGLNWDLIETIAEELYPETGDDSAKF